MIHAILILFQFHSFLILFYIFWHVKSTIPSLCISWIFILIWFIFCIYGVFYTALITSNNFKIHWHFTYFWWRMFKSIKRTFRFFILVFGISYYNSFHFSLTFIIYTNSTRNHNVFIIFLNIFKFFRLPYILNFLILF